MKSNIFFTIFLLLLLLLAGCNEIKAQSDISENQNTDICAEPNISNQDKNIPDIEQDIYIKEAIKQIEINKSKLDSSNQKDFMGEYSYRASDSDSKISARRKASNELKRIILEEIGVHITSTLNINKESSIDGRVRIKIKEVITTYTAGSVNLKILNEKWDGKQFYLKGVISIDPDSVSQGISEGLKAESEKQTISQLKQLLDAQSSSLDYRSNELKTLQNSLTLSLVLTKSKESELKSLKLQLANANKKLKRYEAEDKVIKSKYDKIMLRVNKNTHNAQELIKRGMRYKDVVTLLGMPDSTDTRLLIYGNSAIVFTHYSPNEGVVKCVGYMASLNSIALGSCQTY